MSVDELDLYSEYMDVWIQLLVRVKTDKKYMLKTDLPTFEKYKEVRELSAYSMTQPHYRQRKLLRGGQIVTSWNIGIKAVQNEIAHRDFNYWHGIKYFTGGNINGEWKINSELSQIYVRAHAHLEF